MPQLSQTHASFSPTSERGIKPWQVGVDYAVDGSIDKLLQAHGIGFCRGVLDQMMQGAALGFDVHNGVAMDTNTSIQQPLSVPSITTPLQFLQNWLPGIVYYATAQRTIDEIIGIDTVGSWEDEEIVQQALELTGSPVPYSDSGVVPLSNWNLNFITRHVVRNELGMRVGKLEQARSARVRVDSGEVKRQSCTVQLEITRNLIGFYGYNSGNNQTYGFLTDPNLLPYNNVAVGAVSGAYTWALKNANEIISDILTAMAGLQTQSQGLINPEKTALTMVVPTNSVTFLSQVSTLITQSVKQWLKANFPNVRIISCPQYDLANSNANVFTIHADTIDDGASTDNRKTWTQVVPAKMQFLGVAMQAKGYEEDYVHATAGALCKRPYAMYRVTGI